MAAHLHDRFNERVKAGGGSVLSIDVDITATILGIHFDGERL